MPLPLQGKTCVLAVEWKIVLIYEGNEMAVEITLIRKVTNENGFSLIVGPCEDDPRHVVLVSGGAKIYMTPDIALKAGQAFIACAEELGA